MESIQVGSEKNIDMVMEDKDDSDQVSVQFFGDCRDNQFQSPIDTTMKDGNVDTAMKDEDGDESTTFAFKTILFY